MKKIIVLALAIFLMMTMFSGNTFAATGTGTLKYAGVNNNGQIWMLVTIGTTDYWAYMNVSDDIIINRAYAAMLTAISTSGQVWLDYQMQQGDVLACTQILAVR